MIKEAIHSVLHSVGYDITRYEPDAYRHGFNAQHLARIAQPRTVFDVGVGNGTYPLYNAYPKARFVLVEPVREYEPTIQKIEREFSCLTYYAAVGSKEGETEFTVDLDDPEKSSLQVRTGLTTRAHNVAKRRIPVTTLDHIVAEHPELERPILLKLDTEGHELEALKGATSLLRETDVVIAEVSVAKRFENGYGFSDIVLFMRDHGFRVSDILNIAHSETEPEPRHMDVMFKKA